MPEFFSSLFWNYPYVMWAVCIFIIAFILYLIFKRGGQLWGVIIPPPKSSEAFQQQPLVFSIKQTNTIADEKTGIKGDISKAVEYLNEPFTDPIKHITEQIKDTKKS